MYRMDVLRASRSRACHFLSETVPDCHRYGPASAAEHRTRFQEAIEARRTVILAAVNRAESGSMRGRVYQGGGVELEFVDRTRAVMKMGGGQAVAGTYTEERDGRVIVTMNNQALVLAREGRTLTGGPVALRRTK